MKQKQKMGNMYQDIKASDPVVNIDKAWDKLNQRIKQAEKNENIKKLRFEGFPVFYRVAAILVVILAAVASIYITIFNQGNMIIYKTEKNEVSKYILPDGTLVELNEMSILKHSKEFTKNNRTVYLDGEAFFYVKPDHLKPFYVETKSINVKVLGTSFNVLIRNENKTEVFVEEGKVNMSLKKDNKNHVNLIPGQIGILDNNNLKLKKNNDINYLSWKTNKIVFKETNLNQVINTLNHTFNANIEIEDKELGNLKYTATIMNQSFNMILDALNSSFKEIEIQKEKNKTIILKSQNIE